MDNRLYFVVGDLAANTLTGLVVGLVCWLLVGAGWNMWLSMLLMMGVGMLLAIFLFFPLGILFGAMEVMVPLMLTGMVSGMVVGMWIPMAPLFAAEAAIIGALCGLASIIAIWTLDSIIRGRVTLPGED